VLALPPAVWGEQQVAEQMTPPAVGLPRGEHRVVREVMEQRVHAGEEQRRDQPDRDRHSGARLDQGGQYPDGQVGDHDACDLPEAAPAIDLQIRGEVLFPALAGWNVHAAAYANSSRLVHTSRESA